MDKGLQRTAAPPAPHPHPPVPSFYGLRHQYQKQCSSNYKNESSAILPNNTEGMNVHEVEAEHTVNAIKQDILKDRSKENCNKQHAISCTIAEQSNPNLNTDSINEDTYAFDASTSSKQQFFIISINKNKVNMLTVSGSTLNITGKLTIRYMTYSH